MAARVLLRRRAVAPLMAATLVSGALIPSIAYAEAPPLDHSRKPIYDDLYQSPLPKAATTTTTPIPSPPWKTTQQQAAAAHTEEEPQQQHHHHRPTPTDRLAVEIGRARLFLYRRAAAAEDAVNRAVDRAFALEQTFTSTVASLAPPRESGERLLPGLCYVLVASMAGSIAARGRGAAARAAAPLALGVAAAWLALPATARNVSDLLWRFEQQRAPAVAAAHLAARDAVQRSWSSARARAQAGRDYVDGKVHAARSLVEDWVKQGK